MPSITLKDVPKDLLARLRVVAARERRSLNQEAIVLIEGALDARDNAEERTRRQIAEWRAIAGRWQSAATFEDEVAALAAARSPGRDVTL